MEPRFVDAAPADMGEGRGRPGVSRAAFTQPTDRQPNRGLTDDSPEFTCTVCRAVFPMSKAHRVGDKKQPSGFRRTGWCVPCGRAKLAAGVARSRAKKRGPDYVLPAIKDRVSLIVDGNRVCWGCNESKSVDSYYLDDSVASGFQSLCITCTLVRKRTAHLLRTYSLSLEKFNELLESQDGVCAICKNPETANRNSERVAELSVDHDHSCCPGAKSCGGCVRSLLCHRCNHVIGMIEKVGSAAPFAEYLQRHARG